MDKLILVIVVSIIALGAIGCSESLRDARLEVQGERAELVEYYEDAADRYRGIRETTVDILDRIDDKITELEQKAESGEMSEDKVDLVERARKTFNRAVGELEAFDAEVQKLDRKLKKADAELQDILEQVRRIEIVEQAILTSVKSLVQIVGL